jgi:hypothetical protein
MARMLGRKTSYGLPCSCCNGPRSVKVERVRENREMEREAGEWRFSRAWADWNSPEDSLYDLDDCVHGCNGQCVYGGSDACNFTCHELTPEIEALFERLDRRAMELMGEALTSWRRV